MLENIRKYTGLFVVMLVLIFIGLVFIGNNNGRGGPGSGPPVVKTKDRTFSQKELDKASRKIRLAQRLASQSNQIGTKTHFYYGTEASQDILTFLGALGANGQEADTLQRHLVYRDLFEQAKKEFSLTPSTEEVQVYQREKIFTNTEGIFDGEAYNKFTDKGLRGLSMTINDMNDFVADLLAFKALTKILSAGVIPNEAAAQETFIANQQEITLSTLTLDLEDFKKDISPTDDEVKTYWEEHQGRYLTDAQRRLTYILGGPDFDAELQTKKDKLAKEAPTPTEEADNAEKTPEELAAAKKKREEEIANTTLTPQERKKLSDQFGLKLDDVICITLQQEIDAGAKKAELERIAKEFNYEVKTTELLSLSELPSDIKGVIRGGGGRTVEQELLDASLTSGDALDSLSPVLGVGQDQWLIFRLDEATEPTEKTFEQAKEQAQIDLIQDKAEKALAEAIENAREEVVQSLANKTSLTEAAAAQNLKVTKHLGLKVNDTIANEPNVREVFRLAAQTKTGEISKAEVAEPLKNRGLIVYVEERDFVESDQNKSGLLQAGNNQEQLIHLTLVQHWFDAAYEQAEVEIVRY